MWGLVMIDDELDQEQIEAIEDGDEVAEVFDAGPDSDDPEDINEQDELPVSKNVAKPSVEEDPLPNVEEKRKEREALARAMDEFLAKGGKIQTLQSEEK